MKCDFCDKSMIRTVDEYVSPATGIKVPEIYTWECYNQFCGHSFVDEESVKLMDAADTANIPK